MAKPKGTILYTGTIDGKTIYEDKRHGLVMRKPGGPSKEQIEKSDTCKPVRDNNSNFKRAVGAASRVNRAFAILKERSGDTDLYDRLKSAIQNTINNDTEHMPGSRMLHKGNVGMMAPVELNGKTCCANVLEREVTSGVKRKKLCIDMHWKLVKHPARATHYQLSSQVLHLDLSEYPGTFTSDLQETEFIPVSKKRILQSWCFKHGDHHPELLQLHGVAIAFYTCTNGQYYLLKNANYNAGVINGMKNE